MKNAIAYCTYLTLILSLIPGVIGVINHDENLKIRGVSHSIRFPSELPEAVPDIIKCDFQKDYADGRDEVNCTRHPFVIPPDPSYLEDLWVQVDIWSKEDDITGRGVLSAYGDIAIHEEHFRICRGESNNSLFIGKLDRETFNFHCYHLNQNPYDRQRIAFSGPYETLFHPQGRELVWKKSTAGHVPQGAVVMGMTPSFQLMFLCRIPEVFLYRTLYFPHTMIGTLSPGTGQCVFTHPELPYLRDYEVLVDPFERTGNTCDQTAFNCSNGECISSHYICDGESDCSDESDEEISMCRTRHGCDDTEFPCSDGKCIPMSRVCETGSSSDVNRNCYDGDDESRKTTYRYCNATRFYCEDESILDIIQRCNGRPDCKNADATDEANCSRYWGEPLATPAQVEDPVWKRANWKEFRGRFSQLYSTHNLSAYAAILRGTYFFRRAPSAYKKAFMYSIFNFHCYSHFHCTYFSTKKTKTTKGQGPFQVLQQSAQEKYEWVKSFKGRIPDGAVMWGLTRDYEPTFICKSRRKRVEDNFNMRFVGILVPSKRKCYFGEDLDEILDYEILRDAQFESGILQGKDTFNCSDDTWIPLHFVCDGQRDCKDGSDENMTRCREKSSCTEDEFPCSDGKCISLSRTCLVGLNDSSGNCLDRNDESESFCGDRENGLMYKQFQCTNGEYIQNHKVCDNIPNCDDGSDEVDCYKRNCTENQFACSNGICLYDVYKCDGYFHCNEGNDERHCGQSLCLKRRCHADSSRVESLWWKRGLWVPYKPWWRLQYVGFQIFEDDLYLRATVYICRLVDSRNGSSKFYMGTLEYERTSRRHVCTARILDGSDRIENFPFEVLMDDSGGKHVWAEGKAKEVPYGSVVGGLTEEYELHFICRSIVKNLIVYGTTHTNVGSFRPRIERCTINDGAEFQLLKDSRLS